jgi:Holliday junction resolvasome RuvABC ATP-dependent DNA helicase subunit
MWVQFPPDERFIFLLFLLRTGKGKPTTRMTSVSSKLRDVERRLKNLEKYSHKQPDMKEIIRDVAVVMEYYRDEEDKKRVEKNFNAKIRRETMDRRRRVKRPPGVRC